MIRLARLLAALLIPLLLGACASAPQFTPPDGAPEFRFETFFPGRTAGEGVFVNAITGSERRFSVAIEGTRDGDTLTLVEDFLYEDGVVDRKTWVLTRTGAGRWSGTREDVVGQADIVEDGRIIRLDYDVLLGGWQLRFRDVMAFEDAGETVLNLAVVSKWGLEIGRVELRLRRVTGEVEEI